MNMDMDMDMNMDIYVCLCSVPCQNQFPLHIFRLLFSARVLQIHPGRIIIGIYAYCCAAT